MRFLGETSISDKKSKIKDGHNFSPINSIHKETLPITLFFKIQEAPTIAVFFSETVVFWKIGLQRRSIFAQ